MDGALVSVALDAAEPQFDLVLPAPADAVALLSAGPAADFAGFALTAGWEQTFDTARSLAELGWTIAGGAGWEVAANSAPAASRWAIAEQTLQHPATTEPSIVTRGPALLSYEAVLNLRLLDADAMTGYAFYGAWTAATPGPRLELQRASAGWALAVADGATTARWPLPAAFDPALAQQFRLRKIGGEVWVAWEAEQLGVLTVAATPAQIAVQAGAGGVAIDLARATALPDA